jgi:glycosyltransferase involved in cell wall biosynthesis
LNDRSFYAQCQAGEHAELEQQPAMHAESRRPLRVLMAADVARSADTGMGRHQWYLARELERSGFQVRAFYAEDASRFAAQQARRFYFPAAVLGEVLRARGEGSSYDAVAAHEGCASLLCLGKQLGLHRAACIVVSHNPEQKVWARNVEIARMRGSAISLRTRVLWPLTRLLQSNYALRHADLVACLSEEDRVFLRDRMKIAESRIGLLANGVEESFFSRVHKEDAPQILFLGSWLPHKGIAEFSGALAGVLPQFPAAFVTIAGTGILEGQVRRSFPPGIHPRIKILPRVEPSGLPFLYARHNIFVLPSWYEGMPLSLLEAMAAGLAPIVTRVGGMKDVVREGVDGLTVPPHSPDALAAALTTLCTDARLRKRLACAAQERARTYSWARAGQMLAEMIHSLAASAGNAVHFADSKVA